MAKINATTSKPVAALCGRDLHIELLGIPDHLANQIHADIVGIAQILPNQVRRLVVLWEEGETRLGGANMESRCYGTHRIYLGPPYIASDAKQRRATLMHEIAHAFLGAYTVAVDALMDQLLPDSDPKHKAIRASINEALERDVQDLTNVLLELCP